MTTRAIVLCAVFASSCINYAASATARTGEVKARARAEDTVLMDWALARCIARAAEGQPLGKDASVSAAALLERGSTGIEIYEKLDSLAATFLARRYGGSVAGDYNVLKCIDLFHSGELEAVIRGTH